jgi:hypothetical protein
MMATLRLSALVTTLPCARAEPRSEIGEKALAERHSLNETVVEVRQIARRSLREQRPDRRHGRIFKKFVASTATVPGRDLVIFAAKMPPPTCVI